MTELRKVPKEYSEFREAKFELLSATKSGIQLADFYVGAVREFYLDDSSRAIYDLV